MPPLLFCSSSCPPVEPATYIEPSNPVVIALTESSLLVPKSFVHTLGLVRSLVYFVIKASIPPLLFCPSSCPPVEPATYIEPSNPVVIAFGYSFLLVPYIGK